MKRFQLFEIEDQAWLPASIRDALTDYLQFVNTRTKPYGPIVPQLEQALERADARRIVDLCAGGAGPWLALRPALGDGHAPTVLLTDKYPNVEAFRHAAAVSDGAIDFAAEPVDATNVPEQLNGFRTMFSSFHHFEPEQATAILRDAVRRGQGIGIFEVTHRSALAMALMFVIPLLVLVLTPLIRPFRFSRLLWTYLVPVVPLIVLFDGLVSCLRTYTPAELKELANAASAGDAAYHWEAGEQRGDHNPLPVTYLIGYPNTDEKN